MRFDWLVTPEVQRRMLEVAREFRKEPQRSEAALWDALRNRRLRGFKFRRQQPIGAFVVDFYCDDASLIVEVDGPIHAYQQEADRQRQEILESLELRVLRVLADEVASDLPSVVGRIERALMGRKDPLSPRERGEG